MAAMVLAGSCLGLHAGTITWSKGALTLSWNTAGNWNSNAVPGAADTARFTSTGLAASDTVTLDANQTIGTLDIADIPTNVTINGGGFGLTLNNGNVISSGTPTLKGLPTTINAPITLGAPGSFSLAVGGYPYLTYAFTQPIDDGGHNYGLILNAGPTYIFTGNNTYGSTTVVRCRSLTLSGANGAITNSDIKLNNGVLSLDNTTSGNNDRLGDSKDIVVDSGGGTIQMYATPSTAAEQAGTVWLNRGVLTLGGLSATATPTLRFAGINRTPGTCMNLVMSGYSFAGTTSVNGMWQPWAFSVLDWPCTVNFVKTNATGLLVPFADTDYAAFPTSGSDSTKIYRITTTNPVVLAAAESVYALAGDASSNVTLQLGNYDLRLASGALIGRARGGPLVSSTGGRLIFGGDEMILAGRHEALVDDSGDHGVGILTLNCPVLCDGAGTKRIVIGGVRGDRTTKLFTFSLIGQDLNGTYGSIFAPWAPNANSSSVIELGGSSDRTVTEYLGGYFALLKSGSGTLLLSGTDGRSITTTTVTGGRLVMANNLALAAAPTVTNAILEIAAGVTNTFGATLQYGATLTGDGTVGTAVTFTNGVHVAPGHAVGKLTISGTTTFTDGSQIDWDLGTGTTGAGTNYDLLNIVGALVLPASPATVTLHVWDAGNGVANPKGVTFTVAQWTTTDPASRPIWVVTNESPKTLDTSGCIVTVTNAPVRKILLSGIKRVPPTGAVLSLR